MTLVETIQNALKENKAVIGHKESIKLIKLSSSKMIVMAKNTPKTIRREIEYNAKLARIPVKVFNGSSKELGIVCGKSFPIMALAIK